MGKVSWFYFGSLKRESWGLTSVSSLSSMCRIITMWMIKFSFPPPPVLCCYPLWFLCIKSTFHVYSTLSKVEWNLQNENCHVSLNGPFSKIMLRDHTLVIEHRIYTYTENDFLFSYLRKIYLELWIDVILGTGMWTCNVSFITLISKLF